MHSVFIAIGTEPVKDRGEGETYRVYPLISPWFEYGTPRYNSHFIYVLELCVLCYKERDHTQFYSNFQ